MLLQEFPSYTVETLLEADWLELERILDYRRARLAIDLFNQGEKGFEQLSEREDLLALLLELGRAQDSNATLDGVYRALKEQRPERDE